MPNEEKNQNTPSIWAWKNTAHITKMGIEGTVAVASLATAIITIFIATGAIAGPAFLASVANPVGIAALFVAAVYFTAAAYSSYQQMHKNEKISGAVTKAEAAKVGAEAAAGRAEAAQKAVEEKAESFATKSDLNAVKGGLDAKLASDDFAKSVVANPRAISVLEGKFQAKQPS